MTKDKDFFWLIWLTFYGLVGIFFCWLPVGVAACRAARTNIPFGQALKWEWESYLLSIEEAVR